MPRPGTYERIIDRFDRGIVNDPRNREEGAARAIANFDILNDSRRMIPYIDSEDGDNDGNNKLVANFVVALRTGTTYSLYAFGRQTALDRPEIRFKNLSTGGTNDLGDNAWDTTANNQGTSTNLDQGQNLFVYYARTDRIYGGHNTGIFAYEPGGSAFTNADLTLSFTNLSNGVVHSKDDILYFGADNTIRVNNNGSYSTGLTLPTHLRVSSIAEHGDYLAIGCASLSGVENSIVYLWDRDSSLSTISESYNWGEGQLQVLEVVDGVLIGISSERTSVTSVTNDRITFRALSGGKAVKLLTIVSDATITTPVPQRKWMAKGRLHFLMDVQINGVRRTGIWSFGRNNPASPFSLIFERLPNNDTTLASNETIRALAIVGDYTFLAYGGASTRTITKTNNSPAFTATSYWESTIQDEGDASKVKKLNRVTVMHEPLASGEIVRVGYQIDERTTFTTFLQSDTDDDISKTAVNIEPRTVTMTIASPAVVTLNNHGLVAGDAFTFSTTGALPTGVTAGTIYYVISAGLATNTFRFSETSGGSAVNTSGSQSGTHTLTRRERNLPEYQEIQFRIESTGGAVVTGLRYEYEIIDRNL